MKKSKALEKYTKECDERILYSFECRFKKLIPTNMDWHGTFSRQMVLVTFYVGRRDTNSFQVSLTGSDDTYVSFATDKMEAGLAAYNDLVVVNSSADLEYIAKKYNLEVDSNGWPSESVFEDTQENYFRNFTSTHSSVHMDELGIPPISIIWPSDIYWA